MTTATHTEFIDLNPNVNLGELGENYGEYTLDVDEYVEFMIDYNRCMRCCMFGFNPYMWPFLMIWDPIMRCFDRENARDRGKNEKLLVTSKYVVQVVGKHSRACRCACFDVGRKEKIIPLNAVLQVNVQEPAGTAICCCVRNRLYTVDVETAASAGAVDPNNPQKHKPEIQIQGLTKNDAYGFRAAVLKAKEELAAQAPPSGAKTT